MDPVATGSTVNSHNSRPSPLFHSIHSQQQQQLQSTSSSSSLSLSAGNDLMESLIPLSVTTDLLMDPSHVPPVSCNDPIATTRSPLPPIGSEVNGVNSLFSALSSAAGPVLASSRVYSPFDDLFQSLRTTSGPTDCSQQEKFESHIRSIAFEIQSTVQLHMKALLTRKEQLIQQLETIQKVYQSVLMQNQNAAAGNSSIQQHQQRSAPFFRSNGPSLLLDRLDCDLDDGTLCPLPNISFTKPDHALFKAISSMGFLSLPAFAPYCSASGEGLESVVPGQNTSFVVLTKNCLKEELLIGREHVTAFIFAFSDPSIIGQVSYADSATGRIQLPVTTSGPVGGSDALVKRPAFRMANESLSQTGSEHFSMNGNRSLVKSAVSCSVADHNNGKYTVSYVLPVFRNHVDHVEVTVLVNGMPMTGCPFRVGVQLQQRQTWKRLTSIGSEGSQVGQFCRPWGVAVARLPANSPLLPQLQQFQPHQQQHLPQTVTQSSQLSNCNVSNNNNNHNNNMNGGQIASREQEQHSAPLNSLTNSPQSNSSSSGASINSPPQQQQQQSLISGLHHMHLHDISPNSSSSSSCNTNTGNNNVSLSATTASQQSVSVAAASATSASTNTNSPQQQFNYLISVADRSNNRIQVFKFDSLSATAVPLSVFGSGPGNRAGQFDRPAGLCFNTHVGHIIVADKDNHRIQVFDLSGRFLFKFGEKGNRAGQFCYPWDVESCPSTQQIIVSDTRNRRIQLFSPYGQYLTHFSQPLDSPRGVAFLGESKLVVSDFNKHRLLIFDRSADRPYDHHHAHRQPNCSAPTTPTPPTNLTTRFIGFGEGSGWGEFLRPQGIAISGSYVFCSDSRNNRICLFNLVTQSFEYLNEDLGLDRPSGIAVIDDLMVVVDFGNNRLQICHR